MGARGRGALLGGGWGRGYCSELPVPRGPLGRGGGAGVSTGATRTLRSQHRARWVGGGWAPYCTSGGGGQAGTPPPLKLEPGEEAGGHRVPSPRQRGEVRPPSLGLGRSLGHPCARAQPPAGHQRQTRPRKRPRGRLPWSPPRQNPSPHSGSAADPPFARLGLGGHGEALVAVTVRAAATDVGDFQLRVAVLLPTQRGLWTPGPRERQALGHGQARGALRAQALPCGGQQGRGSGAAPCPCRGQVAQGTGQGVGVEVWWVERRGQLGEGASEVRAEIPGVLREGAAEVSQQARGLGVAGGTWGGDRHRGGSGRLAHSSLPCST